MLLGPRLAVPALLVLPWLLVAAPPAAASEMHPETIAAFDRVVEETDSRFARENQQGAFLWMDGQPEAKRRSLYEELHRGEVVITRVEKQLDGKPFDIPSGMLHHWVGVVFVPGATVKNTLRLLQDYDHHEKTYAPEVIRAKLRKRDGDYFQVYFRFFRKKILTVVLDTEHDAWYQTLGPTRATSRSRTTRINQVENYGKPDERQKPVGEDDGFLWRLYSYWRMEEKDGGTYVQCESLTLTRDIPWLLRPIIGPFVTSIPRESLISSLGNTRRGLLNAMSKASVP
jgi:hypothetical protein